MKSRSNENEVVQRNPEMDAGNFQSKTPPELNLGATTESGPIQAYMESTLDGKAAQISKDLSLAVTPDDPHGLYADAGKVTESNEKLKGVGAAIRLQETGETATAQGESNSKTLHKVLPINLMNRTGGEDMDLYADCGRSNSMITGSLDRAANYTGLDGKDRQSQSGDPAAMKLEIFNHVFTTLTTDAKYKDDPRIQRVVKTFYKYKQDAADYQDKIASEPDERKHGRLRKMQEVSWRKMLETYDRLPTKTKTEFDKQLGINAFANPDIGEGYTISSGGNYHHGMKDQTWNFHWAGVVMKSSNGKDNVTLENYAVGDWDAQNSDWAFAMYGSAEEGGQTFHEKMNATKGFGRRPTSMAIGRRQR